MTNLVTQIRSLKNNDPEAGEETRGWNNALDAVLELFPVEPGDERPINKAFVTPHIAELILHRVPENRGGDRG
jgi:hypothetical protein